MQENPGWRQGELITPDSFMRLVRIEDMLAAGRVLFAVMRDGSGHGTILHWSHCLDLMLLALAAPFAPWLGWHGALDFVGLLSGPLSLAGLGAAVAWAAAPVSKPGWLWLGGFAAGSATTIRNYGLLGQVSHHVLLVVVAVMAAGWALRVVRGEARPGVGGAAMGVWTGVGLWLSPETVPFTLMGVVVVWAAWLAAPSARLQRALVAHGVAFLGVVVLVVGVDPPAAGWLAVEPDRVSVPFVALAGGALVAAVAAGFGKRWAPVVCGVAACGVWLAAFPQVLHGTAGLMSPEAAAAFFSGITEMAPVGSVGDGVNFLLGGVLATGVLAGWAWGARGAAGFWPLVAASGCSFAGLVMAGLHIRFSAYPQADGAVVLPVLLSRIDAGRWPALAQSAARLGAIGALVAGPALYARLPGRAGTGGRAAVVCDAAVAAKLLAGHDGEIVLAQPEDTPELLYRSRVLTVGSLYHRAPAGFMRLRAAWREVPGAAPGVALRATGARLVLGCTGAARSALVGGVGETTLMDRVDGGDAPGWLKRVGAEGGVVLYEVR